MSRNEHVIKVAEALRAYALKVKEQADYINEQYIKQQLKEEE